MFKRHNFNNTKWLHVIEYFDKNTKNLVVHFNVELKKRPQSWASTPDIDEVDLKQSSSSRSNARTAEEHNVDVTLKLPVPPRRHTTALDIKEVSGFATIQPLLRMKNFFF